MNSTMLKLFTEHKVISWHEHVWFDDNDMLDFRKCENMVVCYLKGGIDIMVCSLPLIASGSSIQKVKLANNAVYSAMCEFPNIIKGMCFVDPGDGEHAIDEIKRCINDLGMIGVKLYHQYHIDHPLQYKIIETCIELSIPILMHAGKLKYMPEVEPNISDGTHFAAIAKLYPQASIIMAHIGGGGDWQWSLKAISDCENIVIDSSGSVIDCGLIEQSIKYLGANRILFGTDGCISHGIGKILASEISDKDKIIILRGDRYKDFL